MIEETRDSMHVASKDPTVYRERVLGVASYYSVYSVEDGLEDWLRRISKLGCLVSTPWTTKSFIYKRQLNSKAGRQSGCGESGWIRNDK